MRKLLLCFCLLFLQVAIATAQTNPTPFDLGSGNYSFTQWDATNPARTYPPNMRLHTYSTTSSLTVVEPLALNYEMNADWDTTYSLISGARFNGLGVDGMSFLNTSSSAYSPFRFFGAMVLGLNTTNRQNVRVTWTGGTVVSQTRLYAIILQYRVGTAGPWSTAIVNGTDTVQYKSSTTGNSAVMPTFTLPATCENQPVVQVRWRMYQWSSAVTGSRPQLRVDEISVVSDASTGTPTKLAVVGVSPAVPSALTPFSVTVQARNAADQARNVLTATDVQVSVFSGSGALSGTLTGTMPAGTNTLVLNNLVYNVAEQGVVLQIARTAGDVLSSALTSPFTVVPRATQLTMTSVPSFAFVGVNIPAVTVTARRADNSTDLNYPGPISITKVSGPGNVTGTLSVSPVNGVANFTNLGFDAPGTYVLSATGDNVSSATSSAIVVVSLPGVTELLMPQYMAARNITLPSYALIRLDNLQPNTAYRFFTSAAEINNLVGFAAGTNVHQNVDASTFSYVPNDFSDFTRAGRFSQFTTGANETSKVMWVNMVPSSNSRFTAGNNMYWYVTLRDTTRSIETRFVTQGTTKTINISTAITDASGIVDTASTCAPKTVICLYDNTTGNTQPISTALVQDEGTVVTGAPAFYSNVEAARTAWATLIPNNLPNGIRRVEQRSLTTGQILKVWVDGDGVWPPSNTVNPTGGNNAVMFATPQVQFPVSLTGRSFCSNQPAVITWNARGVSTVDLQITSDGTNFTTIASGVNALLGTFTWTIPSMFAGGNNLRFRIVDTERPTTVSDISGFVNVNTPAEIIAQPENKEACLGGTVTLTVRANGTSLSYQWEKDGVLMAGRTSATLDIPTVTNGTSGLYRCIINGASGCPGATSGYAFISIIPELSIVSQPQSTSAAVGGTAVLRVEANLQSGLQYQWYRGTTLLVDNARITGTRSATLTLRNMVSADFGNDYLCRVVSNCGSILSEKASISSASITITSQPLSADACAGTETSFTAAATATGTNVTITYQWLLNNTAINDGAKYSGAKTAVLTVKSILASDAGQYACKVTASNGAVAFTTTASLRVSTGPKILAQTGTVSACDGDTARLSVTPMDTAGVTYQWWYKGGPISGATSSTLTRIASVTTEGSYVCVVTSNCGSDTAKQGNIIRVAGTVITTQMRKETKLLEGATIVLTVEATGKNLRYFWAFNGKALPNDTTASLTIRNAKVSDAGTYSCRIIGDCGAVDAEPGSVVVTSDVNELAEYGFTMFAPTPNPANDRAVISFELASPRFVTLSLIDVLGREVLTVVNGLVETGNHSLNIDCSSLLTGSYTVRLLSSDAVITRRLVIAK